ncbi:hypothetical protein C1T31_01325 [Hanstruepera neustonica]|uniref:Uncharacterized protein n=1 Tax=Hanstruepera neustonica TaxID=1445657 RepID=A0A2K1E3E9_9FLAO|nr:hypothetical protein [Hanstruepera neustonica]PNQ74810.1 hypothetical protein C1T31_01325 [Hanstruepera neustonica]
MKSTQELLTEIARLIRDIETNYPEVYQYLDENPITIPNMEHPKVDRKELEDYLESLKQLISKH